LLELALAGASLLVLVAVLSGIWLGLRLTVRDAALLSALDKRVADTEGRHRGLERSMKGLEEDVDGALERIERKRKSAAGAATRAEKALEEPPTPEVVEVLPAPRIPDSLTGRERRLALARMHR